MVAGIGLNDPDDAGRFNRVVNHCQIARLKNIERHLTAGQQKRARQRKNRYHFGQISRAGICHIHRETPENKIKTKAV
jgi:hypothetical protein